MTPQEQVHYHALLNSLEKGERCMRARMGNGKLIIDLERYTGKGDIQPREELFELFAAQRLFTPQYNQLFAIRDMKSFYLQEILSKDEAQIKWFIHNQPRIMPEIHFRDLKDVKLSTMAWENIFRHGSLTFPVFEFAHVKEMAHITSELTQGHEIFVAYLDKQLAALNQKVRKVDENSTDFISLRDCLNTYFSKHIKHFAHLPWIKDMLAENKPELFISLDIGQTFHFKIDFLQTAKNYPISGWMPYHYDSVFRSLLTVWAEQGDDLNSFRMELGQPEPRFHDIYLDMKSNKTFIKTDLQAFFLRYFDFVKECGTHFCDHNYSKEQTSRDIQAWICQDKLSRELKTNLTLPRFKI